MNHPRPTATFSRRLKNWIRRTQRYLKFMLMSAVKRRQLHPVQDNTRRIRPGDIVLLCVLRNELSRIPHFLRYYRDLGVHHFLFIDNESTDGFQEYMRSQEDCSVWEARGSYKAANSGLHWLNAMLDRFGRGRWCVVVDPDEYLVYPDVERTSIPELTDSLERCGQRSLFTFMLDMYSDKPVSETRCRPDTHPLGVCPYFDGSGYQFRRGVDQNRIRIRGGVRKRMLFEESEQGPALNKYPLVYWRRGMRFLASTHSLVSPYPGVHHHATTGCLLHFKFLSTLTDKAAEELDRRMHFGNGIEYERYAGIGEENTFLCDQSVHYRDSGQLVAMGMMATPESPGLYASLGRGAALHI